MGKNFRVQRWLPPQEFHHTSRIRPTGNPDASPVLHLRKGSVLVNCSVGHLVLLSITGPISFHIERSFSLPGERKFMLAEVDLTHDTRKRSQLYHLSLGGRDADCPNIGHGSREKDRNCGHRESSDSSSHDARKYQFRRFKSIGTGRIFCWSLCKTVP
jgi:hypothetical protein